MKIDILHDPTPEQDWVHIYGDYKQFHAYGDSYDYVEDTIYLMQTAATKCFTFPFYVHFEGYDDSVENILLKRTMTDIHYQNSDRTVLTMLGGKTYNAGVPSFTVTIPNKEILEMVFKEWFNFAFDNLLWLVTQHHSLRYTDGFAAVSMNESSVVLTASHDAQSLVFITNRLSFQNVQDVQSLF